ncbi:hypothetical protein ABIB25_004880 [Nakamurella sp. UYEF19]|uniref:hypothetical protein n=1 Tax=Nakamurella sp. UYEF19 TaxID=1756392 RepID=UPI0033925DA4
MSNELLIRRVQQALSAAADGMDVTVPLSAPDVPNPQAPARPRSRNNRWLLPAAAAAAVAAVLAAGVLAWHHHETTISATQVTVSGNVADVGGVRFPVPVGWQTKVTSSDSAAVHVCVATQPSAPCDGVQWDIAVPGWSGSINILHQPPFFDQCSDGSSKNILTDDHNPIDVAGRAGVHEWAYCGSTPAAVSHLWQLDDGSLQVYSPPGRYVAEITSMVAGLDLTQWAHPAGPQVYFFTSASAAPPTS